MKCNSFNLSVFLLTLLLGLSSCRKEYDSVPVDELPHFEQNITIAEVIVEAKKSGSYFSLNDKFMKAVVIADDESGNFYKQLIVQDSTAGIRIDIDAKDLFEYYPIGREVYIKGEGLYAYLDDGLPVIVASKDPEEKRIGRDSFKQKIIGGAYNQPVTPVIRDLLSLTPADYFTLIQLNNVEISPCDAGDDYGLPNAGKNVEITECATGGNIIMRNSGFAKFAFDKMPVGNGSLIAVMNAFRGTPQLVIRDKSDVSGLTGARCTTIPTFQEVSIANLRNQYPASSVATGKIRGIVISDAKGKQWQGKNMVIQQPNGAGITMRFTNDHYFEVGDYVEVEVEGGTLGEYQDLLQVSDLPLCRAQRLPNHNNLTITPRIATINDVLNNLQNWESTLVEIQSATFNTGGTFDGSNININDGSGTIDFFSRFLIYSDFVRIPTGAGQVRAVVSENNGRPQLLIRYYDDLIGFATSGGGGGGGGSTGINTIQDIRDAYNNGTSTLPTSTIIGGIVISDKDAENINNKNIVLQQSNGAGIVVRFDDPNTTFSLGDSLMIDFSAGSLGDFNGLLQVADIPNANVTIVNSGNSITPRVATVSDIQANGNAWESTLVKVVGATITGSGGTYSGGTDVNDATGTIGLFTRTVATFSGTALPTSSVSVTAIVSDFNGIQLNLRNGSDVQ